ncbi:cellulose biosynthesis protein BcsQ [Paraburkholderia caballeronis]|uniref:Cellulose synthase operon protein YhjQ n=1 Tax=Paraburkholderia caballeronis TaxID=416943 RepID=A0A1H7LE23_9BURK|nr:cellulose biosynthesis protein BcsQ [Paraburkholderia caballeronis]PXW28419.1 cellulose synthase operon protein YhjQ [Paraburkholderia caballeronis]PXX03785.1 cellulose synthase operon protein YhjQ [Paraburkholderia caballeronis]RAK04529.1 cellulose synthase operon protein YhjQ [Paraburkholderia caballeronis]SED76327.1 cellulose synthase operon protein YhjQ [Paraburkholderia caballeronis]SEK97088.1 cellulose synthase operon protein YhjQ [Paraburkholderia caballeronis]
MKTVAVVSTVGGAGRTTLTAALAGLLVGRKHAALAVECDPRNVLALHFGLREPARAGLVSYLHGADTTDAALQSDDDVLVVPWGGANGIGDAGAASTAPDAPGAPNGVESTRLAADPAWLRGLLARVELPPDAIALIDTPTWPSIETSQAIDAADLVLAVLPPAPAICATLPRFRAALAGKPCAYVANAVMPARELHIDVLALLRATLGNAMLPYQIHADAGVPEALARSENFCASAPGSRTAHDLHGLAAWLSRWANGAEEVR